MSVKLFWHQVSGILDFKPDLQRIKPDVFIVNEEGHTPEKKSLCSESGVEYVVLPRIPEEGTTHPLQFRKLRRN